MTTITARDARSSTRVDRGKNDRAWIEQKNGAVVRKLLGYRRFEGLAAARAIARLYGASRLFVNFFQPSFKLAFKQRDGAKGSKRYHPPLTPYERLLHSDSITTAAKMTLREVAADLDPLKLLEEMRAVQLKRSAKPCTESHVDTGVTVCLLRSEETGNLWRLLDCQVRRESVWSDCGQGRSCVIYK